jgi:hypothetical protein
MTTNAANARHHEHVAVTVTTNPSRFVLIVSDVFVLILSGG